MVLTTVYLPEHLMRRLEKLVELGYYSCKSEAIRSAIKDLLEFHFGKKGEKEQYDSNFIVEYYENGMRKTIGYKRLGNAIYKAKLKSKHSYAIILDKNDKIVMEFANEKKLKEM